MARVQYGTIVTGLKGKLGGQVFQNGNTIQVLRNKNSRKGSDTLAKSQTNQAITYIAGHWRGLTPAQRTSYDSGALSWPFTDKFGNTYYGSGYQFHNAYSAGRLLLQAPLQTAPNLPVSTEPVGTMSYTMSNAGNYNYANSLTSTIDQTILLYASAPYAPGRNANNPTVRLITGYSTKFFTNKNFKTEYQTIFGVPPVGSYVTLVTELRAYDWPKAVKIETKQQLVSA